jgi:hypothetical protein
MFFPQRAVSHSIQKKKQRPLLLALVMQIEVGVGESHAKSGKLREK